MVVDLGGNLDACNAEWTHHDVGRKGVVFHYIFFGLRTTQNVADNDRFIHSDHRAAVVSVGLGNKDGVVSGHAHEGAGCGSGKDRAVINLERGYLCARDGEGVL